MMARFLIIWLAGNMFQVVVTKQEACRVVTTNGTFEQWGGVGLTAVLVGKKVIRMNLKSKKAQCILF